MLCRQSISWSWCIIHSVGKKHTTITYFITYTRCRRFACLHSYLGSRHVLYKCMEFWRTHLCTITLLVWIYTRTRVYFWTAGLCVHVHTCIPMDWWFHKHTCTYTYTIGLLALYAHTCTYTLLDYCFTRTLAHTCITGSLVLYGHTHTYIIGLFVLYVHTLIHYCIIRFTYTHAHTRWYSCAIIAFIRTTYAHT